MKTYAIPTSATEMLAQQEMVHHLWDRVIEAIYSVRQPYIIVWVQDDNGTILAHCGPAIIDGEDGKLYIEGLEGAIGNRDSCVNELLDIKLYDLNDAADRAKIKLEHIELLMQSDRESSEMIPLIKGILKDVC